MVKVYNDILPFRGFLAITIWPLLFIRNNARKYFDEVDERHENIHGEQQKEMLLIFFFLWYCIEWIVRLCIYRNRVTAYKNISFEREAYSNQEDVCYLDFRVPFSWIKYIKL